MEILNRESMTILKVMDVLYVEVQESILLMNLLIELGEYMEINMTIQIYLNMLIILLHYPLYVLYTDSFIKPQHIILIVSVGVLSVMNLKEKE